MQTNTTTPIEFVVRYETATNYTDEAQWIADVGNAYELYQSSGWNLVNVLAKGINDLRSRADKSVLYQRVHEQYPGLSVKRMQNLVSLARKPYAKQAQDLGLEIAHVEAVLGLPDDEAEALLLDAAEQSLSANAIGGIIRERRLATVAAPNTTQRADLPVVGNEDDEPPFARTQGNVLYDDTDAQASHYATDPSAYDESSDTEDYTYTGEEVMTIITKAMYRLRAQGYYEQQNTVRRWLQLIENQAY